MYNVEIALDLKELNSITRQRQSLRGSLEKAIAYYEATNVRPEVFIQTGKVKEHLDPHLVSSLFLLCFILLLLILILILTVSSHDTFFNLLLLL